MTDAISLALSTGLGPVIGIIIIFVFMGLVYKMAGSIPAVIVGVIATFALTYLDFIPIYWGLGIIFAFVAGLIYTRVGDNRDGY
jgi:preprotein translocase subunit SecD